MEVVRTAVEVHIEAEERTEVGVRTEAEVRTAAELAESSLEADTMLAAMPVVLQAERLPMHRHLQLRFEDSPG